MAKVYYTNARLFNKTLLLAGPFATAAEAEHCIDLCGPALVLEQPTAVNATFGVVELNRPDGYGLYNKALRANGINIAVPEN